VHCRAQPGACERAEDAAHAVHNRQLLHLERSFTGALVVAADRDHVIDLVGDDR